MFGIEEGNISKKWYENHKILHRLLQTTATIKSKFL